MERGSTRFLPLAKPRGLAIKEVILENFMSYEYGRIPLRPGLNEICGPNGSGKSSILLGISVALGQAYTERSKRLSDLVRRGKEQSRVSLLFDNRPKEGKRPVPFSRSDTFMLSRYLRRDGSYWFEADYKEISKAEVTRLLKGFGLNPDNLLIIMHQGMIEEFTVLSPQERLRMVEEAVGFLHYRENILDAQQKLSSLVSEESSLAQLIESASKTLGYWREMYERFLVKQGLLEEKARLERELAWAKVIRQEGLLKSIKDRLEGRKRALEDLDLRLAKTKKACEESHNHLLGHQSSLTKLHYTLAKLEREMGSAEASEKALREAHSIVEQIEKALRGEESSSIKQLLSTLKLTRESIYNRANDSRRRQRDIEGEISQLQAEIGKAEKRVYSTMEKHLGYRINEALLSFRKKEVERELRELSKSLEQEEAQLKELMPEADRLGPRIETDRGIGELIDELKMIGLKLEGFSDVPDDAERIYSGYSDTYEELKQRLKTVSENKERVLAELSERRKVWRQAIGELIDEVGPIYSSYLSMLDANGHIRLVNDEDIERAGLEVLVGFKGSSPVVLDSYSQSGGERSVAVMAFLLSLQKRLLSPFRAIDEFDLHMDPRNREMVFRMVFSEAMKEEGVQHVIITPSQLAITDPSVNVIVVQSSSSGSSVRRLA